MAPSKTSSLEKRKPAPEPHPARAAPIRRPAGLVEEVYNRVRADIMALRIAPGTRVTIESLARTLGVSQTPIREALSMLEANGLVTKQHLIGYCTAPILNRAQFQDIHEMRLLIEPSAARAAALKISDDGIAELSRLLARMRPKRDGEARGGIFAEQHAEFHARIAQAGGNALIAESLTRMHIHLHIFRLCHADAAAGTAHEEDEALFRAIAARDADAAEAAMRTHVQRSHARFAPFAKA